SPHETPYQVLTWMRDSSTSGLAELMECRPKIVELCVSGHFISTKKHPFPSPKTKAERFFSLGKNLPCHLCGLSSQKTNWEGFVVGRYFVKNLTLGGPVKNKKK
ncbi:Hypothetical predicted protein, partial [Marmota monax]